MSLSAPPASAPADPVRHGLSLDADPACAVAELAAHIARPDAALTLVFCAGFYGFDALAGALRRALPAATLGCTSAGVIAPGAYPASGISGVSFGRDAVTAVAERLGELGGFRLLDGRRVVERLRRRLGAQVGALTPENCFALLLVDGLSGAEERVVSSLSACLGGIGLVGGSAGDNLAFERSFIYAAGAFHADSAVLVLVHSRLPFRLFSTHHFSATEQRAVVTRADPARRRVMELDGRPAAETYARLLGCPVEALDHEVFAAWPLLVRIGSSHHVRALANAHPDGSITLGCAIDEGVVLRLASRGDMLDDLRATFDEVESFIGPPLLTLGFNCAFRHLEMERDGHTAAVAALLQRVRAVGFSSFGEQFNAMHLNQTFTGVAFGAPA